MSFRVLKLFTIALPTLIIGGFEWIRHEWLLEYMSMEAGNYFITVITFVLSYLFSEWMFRKIRLSNRRLAEEQARRAVYEERERLARELHDNIAQMLFFLNVHLKQGRTEEARSAVAEIDRHVRQAIFNLRASPDDGIGFADRVRKWLREWSAISGVEVDESIDVEEPFFTPGEQVQLFSIIQEAFVNIRKHSMAERAVLRLTARNGKWKLTVEDDGRGFRDRETDGPKYGLSIMRKRASEMGAAFEIRHPERGGTVLTVSGVKERTGR